jgi:hypothetical protein
MYTVYIIYIIYVYYVYYIWYTIYIYIIYTHKPPSFSPSHFLFLKGKKIMERNKKFVLWAANQGQFVDFLFPILGTEFRSNITMSISLRLAWDVRASSSTLSLEQNVHLIPHSCCEEVVTSVFVRRCCFIWCVVPYVSKTPPLADEPGIPPPTTHCHASEDESSSSSVT